MLKKAAQLKEKIVNKMMSKSGLGAWETIVGIAIGLVAAALIITWLNGSLTDILDALQDKLMDFFQ
jgi:translation elongation factor EF-1beta